MKKIFLTLALVTGMFASAQVRIGGTGTAVDSNAILELKSTSKGLLFPRVTLTGTTDILTVGAHTAGMTVYNTATAGDVTPGLYANSGSAWVKLGGSSSSSTLSVTVPTTDNYTVLDTDAVIYRNLTASGTITFPSTIPAGKVFYVANTSATNSWIISPTPINTGQNSIEAGLSHTIITLGGGQLLIGSGY